MGMPERGSLTSLRARKRAVRLVCASSIAALATGVLSITPASAHTHAGAYAYVTSRTSDSVNVVDISSMTVVKTISVGRSPSGPVGITLSNGKAYAASWGDNTVSVISEASNTVTRTIHVGIHPLNIAASPDGHRIAVTNLASNTVSIIDAAADKVVNTIHLPNFATAPASSSPEGLSFSPDGSSLAVTTSAGPVIDIDTSSTDLTKDAIADQSATTGGESAGVAFDPNADDDVAYVANAQGSSLDTVDWFNHVVTTQIPVESKNERPAGVLISADNTKAWVTVNDYSHPAGQWVFKLEEINLTGPDAFKVGASVTLASDGAGPAWESPSLAFTPDGSQIVVPMPDSNKVALVDTASASLTGTAAMTAPYGVAIPTAD